ncbi:MAG TPA: FadR/GntR family transcriptional regulator [Chloroflexota bacterium]
MTNLVFDKLTPVRLSEQVATSLASMILDSHLRPGDKLPSERELSAAFGVSRPVVRESIKLLEERGLLLSRTGRGAFVTDPGLRGITSSISVAYQMQACTTENLHEARSCVECFSARLAAERATPDDIARMEQAIGAMDVSLQDPGTYIVADAEFHAALAAATHNPLFQAMTSPLVEVIMSRGHSALSRGPVAERHAKHHELVRHIKNRDGAAAAETMRVHLNLGKEAFA